MEFTILLIIIAVLVVAFCFCGAFKLDDINNREEKDTCHGYQCFHCGHYTVHWESDFDFSDYGYEGEGVINVCHCSNCGAEIEYAVPCGEVEDET